MTRRVVITGMGTVNGLSLDLMGYWRALLEGRSGVGLIEQFDTTAFRVKFAGGLNEFEEQHGRYIKDGPGGISPFVIPKMIVNAAPGNIALEFGLSGPNTA